MNNRTFTQLNDRTAQIFKAIQVGLVPPNSDAMNELAELIVVLEDAPKPSVVARLTVTRKNGWKTIVEIHSNARFHSFFHYYKQFANKRSTKELIRTASRNEGGLRTSGLDAIERKLMFYQNQSNPVIRSSIRIIRKRTYRKLLSARPDELGLTHTEVHLPLVSFPSRINHSSNARPS
jgi:hypothetical protein